MSDSSDSDKTITPVEISVLKNQILVLENVILRLCSNLGSHFPSQFDKTTSELSRFICDENTRSYLMMNTGLAEGHGLRTLINRYASEQPPAPRPPLIPKEHVGALRDRVTSLIHRAFVVYRPEEMLRLNVTGRIDIPECESLSATWLYAPSERTTKLPVSLTAFDPDVGEIGLYSGAYSNLRVESNSPYENPFFDTDDIGFGKRFAETLVIPGLASTDSRTRKYDGYLCYCPTLKVDEFTTVLYVPSESCWVTLPGLSWLDPNCLEAGIAELIGRIPEEAKTPVPLNQVVEGLQQALEEVIEKDADVLGYEVKRPRFSIEYQMTGTASGQEELTIGYLDESHRPRPYRHDVFFRFIMDPEQPKLEISETERTPLLDWDQISPRNQRMLQEYFLLEISRNSGQWGEMRKS